MIGARQQSGVLVLTVNETNRAEYDLCAAIDRELVDAVRGADGRAVAIDMSNVELVAGVGVVPSTRIVDEALAKHGGVA